MDVNLQSSFILLSHIFILSSTFFFFICWLLVHSWVHKIKGTTLKIVPKKFDLFVRPKFSSIHFKYFFFYFFFCFFFTFKLFILSLENLLLSFHAWLLQCSKNWGFQLTHTLLGQRWIATEKKKLNLFEEYFSHFLYLSPGKSWIMHIYASQENFMKKKQKLFWKFLVWKLGN